jgi:hypothetical protein
MADSSTEALKARGHGMRHFKTSKEITTNLDYYI